MEVLIIFIPIHFGLQRWRQKSEHRAVDIIDRGCKEQKCDDGPAISAGPFGYMRGRHVTHPLIRLILDNRGCLYLAVHRECGAKSGMDGLARGHLMHAGNSAR